MNLTADMPAFLLACLLGILFWQLLRWHRSLPTPYIRYSKVDDVLSTSTIIHDKTALQILRTDALKLIAVFALLMAFSDPHLLIPKKKPSSP